MGSGAGALKHCGHCLFPQLLFLEGRRISQGVSGPLRPWLPHLMSDSQISGPARILQRWGDHCLSGGPIISLMTRHSLQIIDQALSPLRSVVLAFKVLRDSAANSLLLTSLLWVINTAGCLGALPCLLVPRSAPGSFLIPARPPPSPPPPYNRYLPSSRSQNIRAGNILLPYFPDGQRLREGKNFPSVQGELMGPNLPPIKITTRNKTANIS